MEEFQKAVDPGDVRFISKSTFEMTWGNDGCGPRLRVLLCEELHSEQKLCGFCSPLWCSATAPRKSGRGIALRVTNTSFYFLVLYIPF